MSDPGEPVLSISMDDANQRQLLHAGEDDESAAELELRQGSVPVIDHGTRLDKALCRLAPEFSRSYLQQLISAGAVAVNDASATKSAAKVKAGDQLQIELRPTPETNAFTPEPISLEVVFEDAEIVVINKAAGMVVHPAPGNWSGTLLNALLARYENAQFLPRAGIVHRLDKDTSGLMVVARTRHSMDCLTKLMARRDVKREYLAIAHKRWVVDKLVTIDKPIGRDPKNRLRMAVVDLEKNAGKAAVTMATLLQNAVMSNQFCLIKCALQTGRTHQIRVHLASIQHPLVSDLIYGGPLALGMTRQALHAFQLAFVHPVTGQLLEFKCPPPLDFRSACDAQGLLYN